MWLLVVALVIARLHSPALLPPSFLVPMTTSVWQQSPSLTSTWLALTVAFPLVRHHDGKCMYSCFLSGLKPFYISDKRKDLTMNFNFVQVRMALHRWHWRISQCSVLFQHAHCFTLVMEYLPRELWNLQPIQGYGLWFPLDDLIQVQSLFCHQRVNLLFFGSVFMLFPAFRVSVSSAPVDLTLQSSMMLKRNLKLAKPR